MHKLKVWINFKVRFRKIRMTVVPIQVLKIIVKPIVPILDTIRIDHRHNPKNKKLAQKLKFFIFNYRLNYPLNTIRTRCLRWMNSRCNHYLRPIFKSTLIYNVHLIRLYFRNFSNLYISHWCYCTHINRIAINWLGYNLSIVIYIPFFSLLKIY